MLPRWTQTIVSSFKTSDFTTKLLAVYIPPYYYFHLTILTSLLHAVCHTLSFLIKKKHPAP